VAFASVEKVVVGLGKAINVLESLLFNRLCSLRRWRIKILPFRYSMFEGVLIGWRCSGVAYNAQGFARFALLCTFGVARCMVHRQKWAMPGGRIAMDMRKDGQDLGCFGESVGKILRQCGGET
jgi:hypothetical protein